MLRKGTAEHLDPDQESVYSQKRDRGLQLQNPLLPPYQTRNPEMCSPSTIQTGTPIQGPKSHASSLEAKRHALNGIPSPLVAQYEN